MPSYKLYDLPSRSKGEVARLLFAYAGVEYEDARMSEEEWQVKKESSLKQLPVLQIDNKQLSRPFAIVRYLAREFKLCGASSYTTARADEFAESMNEIVMMFPWNDILSGEDVKELVAKTLRDSVAPALLDVESDMKGEHFYDDKLTYGDLAFVVAAELLLEFSPAVLDATPKLKVVHKNVSSLPRVAEWLKERPRPSS